MEYDEEGVKPLVLYSIIGKTPNGPQAKCSLWDFFSAVSVSGTVRGQLSFYGVRHCPWTNTQYMSAYKRQRGRNGILLQKLSTGGEQNTVECLSAVPDTV
jgi:hypothetical protein